MKRLLLLTIIIVSFTGCAAYNKAFPITDYGQQGGPYIYANGSIAGPLD